jgi:hypothetical protein
MVCPAPFPYVAWRTPLREARNILRHRGPELGVADLFVEHKAEENVVERQENVSGRASGMSVERSVAAGHGP